MPRKFEPQVTRHRLRALSIEAYEHTVGVVHYSYSASVAPKDSKPLKVSGRWTEIYLKQDGRWLMISVSGRPDPQAPETQATGAATIPSR